jgi:hypothetical protein
VSDDIGEQRWKSEAWVPIAKKALSERFYKNFADDAFMSALSLLPMDVRSLPATMKFTLSNRLVRLGVPAIEIAAFHAEVRAENVEVYSYWSQNATSYPTMYAAHMKMCAVNPSEASCERAFSALGLLHSDERVQLGVDTLRDQMFVRHNHAAKPRVAPTPLKCCLASEALYLLNIIEEEEHPDVDIAKDTPIMVDMVVDGSMRSCRCVVGVKKSKNRHECVRLRGNQRFVFEPMGEHKSCWSISYE